MAHLSLPDYAKGRLVTPDEVETMTEKDLLKGYLILRGKFSFSSNVKYPSIPCFVDDTTTVYPLNGECNLTGPEYLLAKNQGCKISILSAFFIPPAQKIKRVGMIKITEDIKPFSTIIKDLQSKRLEYPKGTVQNLLYKEIGNSIYGNLVRGISNKRTFNTNTGGMVRIGATELSNPILASWTTAFIRSVIGECLHNISMIGGRVVSVTTDGFITDLENLEWKLMRLPSEKIPLLTLFRSLREELHDNPQALEVKHSGIGIVS